MLILESENMLYKEMIVLLSDPCCCTQNSRQKNLTIKHCLEDANFLPGTLFS